MFERLKDLDRFLGRTRRAPPKRLSDLAEAGRDLLALLLEFQRTAARPREGECGWWWRCLLTPSWACLPACVPACLLLKLC